MFGTLVVSLPSQHVGGEVVVGHENRSCTFRSSTNSEFGTSFAAWYSDITHEIKPVTSGHRLVLTYNLIQDGPGSVPSAYVTGSRLDNAVGFWKSAVDSGNGGCPNMLLYQLGHKYATADLSFDRMKGKDQQRLIQLRQVCQRHRFCLFIGCISREVLGTCDNSSEYDGYHSLSDIINDDIELECVTDQNGIEVGTGIPVVMSNLIQELSSKGAPDEESYTGFTGNAGASAIHWYRKTASLSYCPTRERVLDMLFIPLLFYAFLGSPDHPVNGTTVHCFQS